MATPLMGYYAPSDDADAGTWGSSVNAQFTNYVDVNFAGLSGYSLSSSNVTMTASECRNQMIRLSGTLLTNVILSPTGGALWSGFKCIENLTAGNFSVTFQNGAGSCIVPQSRRVVIFVDSTYGPRIVSIAGSSTADPIPAGTVSLFYQSAAPAGWTTVSSLNDYALRIVSGSGGNTGGSAAFSTVFQTQTPSGSLSLTGSTTYLDWGADSGTSGIGRLLVGTGTTLPSGVASATSARPLSVASNTFTGNGLNFNVRYANIILASRN